MEKNEFERNWPHLQEVIKDKWKNLVEEDFREVQGKYDQFVSKLQEKYELSKEQAEEQIKNWVHDDDNSSKHKKMWAVPEEKPPKKRKAG
jgi:uncharacterized protein YjbJ (UPF0337 family)